MLGAALGAEAPVAPSAYTSTVQTANVGPGSIVMGDNRLGPCCRKVLEVADDSRQQREHVERLLIEGIWWKRDA